MKDPTAVGSVLGEDLEPGEHLVEEEKGILPEKRHQNRIPKLSRALTGSPGPLHQASL